MKKILLLLLLSCCSFSYGQRLILTSKGMKDYSNGANSYVVISVEGKSAKELYKGALKFIYKSYKNPDEVIKGKLEGEYLKFHTYVAELANIYTSLGSRPINSDYTISLSFKDGKMKFEVESYNFYFNNSGEYAFSIYDSDDKIRTTYYLVKSNFEKLINSHIGGLIKEMVMSDNSDEW